MASILDLKNFSSLVAKRPEEENWFQRYLYSLISKYTSHTHYQWIIAFKVISKYCSAPILWKLVGGKRVGRKSWKTWWMSLSAGGDDAVPVPVQGMMQHPTFFSFSSSSQLFSFTSVLYKITSLFSPTLFCSLSNSLSSSLSTLSFSSSTTLLTAIFPPLLIPRTPFYSTLTLIPHHSDKRNWTICSSLMTSDEIQNIWALRNSTSRRELDAVLIN